MSLPPTGSFKRGGGSCDAPPFFLRKAASGGCEIGRPQPPRTGIPTVLHDYGYYLKKHKDDVPLDSRGPLAYFVCVVKLENP
jgi:hypothetical protein